MTSLSLMQCSEVDVLIDMRVKSDRNALLTASKSPERDRSDESDGSIHLRQVCDKRDQRIF